jgi:hypothetical protein
MAAYPVVSGPYGFKPVNLIGGQVFSGSTRNLPIQYNYGTAIYYGDFVKLTSGYVEILANTIASNVAVGVFLGCYYTNPTTKNRQWSQYYPGNVTAGDITAIICDDPDTVFRVAVTTAAGSSTIGSASSIIVGQNVAGNTLTGNATSGNSNGAVVGSTPATSTGNFRVMNLVPDTQITSGAVYVSGTGTTTLTVSGLAVGQVIPIGTDVYNVVAGQLQFTGSSTTAATTVASATSQALTVIASTATISTTYPLALVQTPEVLVKITFGAHRYYVA